MRHASAGGDLRLGQVAARLNISRAHAARLVAAGVLPACPTALGRLFSQEDVEHLARERSKRAISDRRVRAPVLDP